MQCLGVVLLNAMMAMTKIAMHAAQENADLTLNQNVGGSKTHVSDVEIGSVGTCLAVGGGRCSRLESPRSGLQAGSATCPRTDGGGGEL